ncbi:Zinc-finger domain of monoamine-oxidase A repressor R1 [Sesbania bispinosa]|nr:Zinc-finger domain of monoamine-oxidase A repressor R1 [Sesbania bispinosa]
MVALPSISTTNIEPEFSSQQLNGNGVNARSQKVKRNNSPRIRVVGSRIYDSSNGITCHQCRQKTRDFAAMCQNSRNGKPCPIKLCHKCLLNRYGEKAEEVTLLSDWKCPKCRGICNCSFCMKKRGHQPTGQLVHTAKASGFKSVSEMLNTTGNLELTKELVVILSGEAGKENSLDENGGLELDALKVQKNHLRNRREKTRRLKESNGHVNVGQNKRPKKPKENHIVAANVFLTVSEKEIETNMNLDPICGVKGYPEAWVANDFSIDPMILASKMHQKMGTTLQLKVVYGIAGGKSQTDRENPLKLKKCFLEFCRVFGKALDIKKGEAEAILRELVRDESPSLITTNGNKSWLQALEDLITESDLVLKDFSLNWLKEGIGGYYDLDLSKKLTLLNFICDEALSTEKLRSYIEDQNLKNSEERKEGKLKVVAAKEKVTRNKVDEMAKAIMPNGAFLSISEHNALISKIKSEAAQAHAEMLETKGRIPKVCWNQTFNAMRIEPEFLDSNGHAFWKLKSYDNEHVLLQDIKVHDVDAFAIDERWFVYSSEKKGAIDKYISLRCMLFKLDSYNNNLKQAHHAHACEYNFSLSVEFDVQTLGLGRATCSFVEDKPPTSMNN